MKNIVTFILCLGLLLANKASAQNKQFVTAGVIEYEKTCNMFALLKKKLVAPFYNDNKPHYDNYLRKEPQFLKLKSTLTFGNNTSLFTPVPQYVYVMYDQPIVSQPNIVFNDFKTGTFTLQKEFNEKTLLVKDTLRKIVWKITDETRVIAGYNCRRANGLVLDSMYAVAFYAEDIHVPGGPESFTGLPGMIMLVALPHDNVSWQATKVTVAPPDEKKLIPPKKGTPVDYKGMHQQLFRGLGQAGELGRYYLKGYTL